MNSYAGPDELTIDELALDQLRLDQLSTRSVRWLAKCSTWNGSPDGCTATRACQHRRLHACSMCGSPGHGLQPPLVTGHSAAQPSTTAGGPRVTHEDVSRDPSRDCWAQANGPSNACRAQADGSGQQGNLRAPSNGSLPVPGPRPMVLNGPVGNSALPAGPSAAIGSGPPSRACPHNPAASEGSAGIQPPMWSPLMQSDGPHTSTQPGPPTSLQLHHVRATLRAPPFNTC